MKKIISLVSLFSLMFTTIGVGALPASAQPLTYATANATVSFSGSGRTLTIVAGSTADSLLIGQTNMTVNISSGQSFTVRDTGTVNGSFRKIDVSDGATTGCASGNAGSEVIISIGTGTRTVIITPTDTNVSCNAVAVAAGGGGGGGGGGGSTSTTTTTQTAEQQKAAEDAATKAAAEKKAAEEKAAQEKIAEAALQPLTVKAVDVTVTDSEKVAEVASSVKAGDLGVFSVDVSNLTVKKTGEATKEIPGEKITVEKQIKAALEKDASNDTAKKALTDVNSAVSFGSLRAIPVSTTVESFSVTDKTSGKSVNVSRVSQTIKAKERLQNAKIFLTVPKDVAKSAIELNFLGLKPKVIQDDPIVEWNIAELKAGDQVELAYQVSKKIESIDMKVVAVASAPLPAETVFVLKDGKFVAVSKEEATKIEAEAAAKKLAEEKSAQKKPGEPVAEKPAEKKPLEPTPEKFVDTSTMPLEPPPSLQAVNEARAAQVDMIARVEAPALSTASSVSHYLTSFSQGTGGVVARNEKAEDMTVSDILPRLNIDLAPLLSPGKKTAPSSDKVALTSAADLERTVAYISYGTQTTKEIGAGERAGALNSYIAACGKIPQTEAEWSDLLKIASGRFPSNTCDKTKERALINFQRVFGRLPDSNNANDQAALTIIQYGLLPVKAVKADGKAKIVPNRDTKKEKQAIAVFRKKFRFDPKTATAWNVVRAIAYSGSKAKAK